MKNQMTAKELKESIFKLMENALLIEDIEDIFNVRFDKFCQQLCKEQRIICSDIYDYEHGFVKAKDKDSGTVNHKILNAKIPEL
jgi:hypothetical protein